MKYKLIFICVLILAISLRFWKLGSFPPGFTWDEAAIGYNAYGILTVHRDEWLTRVPLTFRSFGDYKSPLAIYLTAISQVFFGLTVFSVRFPVALAGVGLVVSTYFLFKVIFKKEKYVEEGALGAMLLVAVSPWALHFSTIAFESMIAACLASLGALFLLKGMEKWKFFMLSGLFYSLSLYAYHSAKIVVPLTIVLILICFGKRLKNWKTLLVFFVVCITLSLPLGVVSVFGNASDRFFGSTVIMDQDKRLKPLPQVVLIMGKNFIAHLDPRYLFSGKEGTYRQSNMRDGVLSYAEGVLILVAILTLKRDRKRRRQIYTFLLIIVCSIIPATLGNDVPHANRALLGLPWFQILAGVGFVQILAWLEASGKRRLRQAVIGCGGVLVLGGLCFHLVNDQRVYSTKEGLKDMQYGMETAVKYAKSQESTVRKIYFTNAYGQAYIFLLFFKQLNPIDFRGGGLANYVISDRPYEDSAGQSNVLIFGTPDQVPGTLGREKEYKYPDGEVVFRVVRQ